MFQETVRHILDFVYYKEGGGAAAFGGATFGDTLFDNAEGGSGQGVSPVSNGAEQMLSDGLSDSEDDT